MYACSSFCSVLLVILKSTSSFIASSRPTLSTFLRVSKQPLGVNLSVMGLRKVFGFSMTGGVGEPVFPATDDELPFLDFEEDFRSGEAPVDALGVPVSAIPVVKTNGGALGVSAIPVVKATTDNVVQTASSWVGLVGYVGEGALAFAEST